MTELELKLLLPDQLANQAKAAGLLTSEAIERLVRDAIRRPLPALNRGRQAPARTRNARVHRGRTRSRTEGRARRASRSRCASSLTQTSSLCAALGWNARAADRARRRRRPAHARYLPGNPILTAAECLQRIGGLNRYYCYATEKVFDAQLSPSRRRELKARAHALRSGRADRRSRGVACSARRNRLRSEKPRADKGARSRRRSPRARDDPRGDLQTDRSATVQHIGKILVLFRESPERSPDSGKDSVRRIRRGR